MMRLTGLRMAFFSPGGPRITATGMFVAFIRFVNDFIVGAAGALVTGALGQETTDMPSLRVWVAAGVVGILHAGSNLEALLSSLVMDEPPVPPAAPPPVPPARPAGGFVTPPPKVPVA